MKLLTDLVFQAAVNTTAGALLIAVLGLSMRPHQGYRNLGRRPIETIQLYLQTVKEEG